MRSTSRSPLLAAVTAALLAVTLGACATAGPSAPAVASDPDVTDPDVTTDPAADAPATAEVAGADLVLTPEGGTPTTVATVTDGELVEVAVRPAGDGPLTVLALVRTTAGAYELRYLNVADDGAPSDLFGFPWRLQVGADSATHADVPTSPVWSPDGDAIAWLEYDADATRLRTLGWLAYDDGTNPADAGSDTVVDVPLGTRLTGWEVTADGTDVLLAEDPGGGAVRLRLDASGARLT